MRAAALASWGVLSIACGESAPPLDTPEGVAIAVLHAARDHDTAAFLAIAENPSQALLDESGARPVYGSYAELLVREGQQSLADELEAASRGPLPTGELRVWSTPMPNGSYDVTVSAADGTLHVWVVSTQHGLRCAAVQAGDTTN
jgi:hypothetical protein